MTGSRGGAETGSERGGPASEARPAVELAPDLKAWLGPRLEELPEDLARAVRACLRRAPPSDEDAVGPPSTIPERLAEAAVRELEAVLELSGERDAAVRLLAADASLTYAFQAAADLEVDIPALADAVGVRGRLGASLAARAGEKSAARPADEPADSRQERA